MRIYWVLVVGSLVGCQKDAASDAKPAATTVAANPTGGESARGEPTKTATAGVAAESGPAYAPGGMAGPLPTSTVGAAKKCARRPDSEVITKEWVAKFFDQIREINRKPEGAIAWHFYFVSADRGKLQRVGNQLAAEGYRVDSIGESSRNPKGKFLLSVTKVERHTVDSLYHRNHDLDVLARENESSSTE